MNNNGQQSPLNVAVLVDLPWDDKAGGHVKVWERFARASTAFDGVLDLTVYFLGEDEREIVLADNVRFRTVKPTLGTQQFRFLKQGGGHTDLASYNRRLADKLANHDILHATSSFAFARTACQIARREIKPLVISTHTDVPKLTRIYTREVVENLFGQSFCSQLLLDRIQVQELTARNATRQQNRLLKACDRLLVSSPSDLERCREFLPADRISYLRRGIDKDLFSPTKRDRVWLEAEYGIPADCPVLLFVGRVDETKRVLTLVNAARQLLDSGEYLHVVIVGEGNESATIPHILGDRVTLTGFLPPETLARIMASSDLFVFPSESEIASNVTLEAKASGLPIFLSASSKAVQYVASPGRDGFTVADPSPEAFAAALRPLLKDPQLRQQVSAAARNYIDELWPSWQEVVERDLIPVWRAARDIARARAGNR